MLIRKAEMFELGANVNVEKVKLWCSILCVPARPHPSQSNCVQSNLPNYVRNFILFVRPVAAAVSGGRHNGDSCTGHGISLATEESKYKKIK